MIAHTHAHTHTHTSNAMNRYRKREIINTNFTDTGAYPINAPAKIIATEVTTPFTSSVQIQRKC